MSSIKLMVRGAAALAMLAVAMPALPCGEAKQQSSATNEKPAAVSKDAVATKTPAGEKSSAKGKAGDAKGKAATASN